MGARVAPARPRPHIDGVGGVHNRRRRIARDRTPLFPARYTLRASPQATRTRYIRNGEPLVAMGYLGTAESIKGAVLRKDVVELRAALDGATQKDVDQGHGDDGMTPLHFAAQKRLVCAAAAKL